jgi:hypothetical protein
LVVVAAGQPQRPSLAVQAEVEQSMQRQAGLAQAGKAFEGVTTTVAGKVRLVVLRARQGQITAQQRQRELQIRLVEPL